MQYQPTTQKMSELFGVGTDAPISIFETEPDSEYLVPKKKFYQFQRDSLRVLLSFLHQPHGTALYIHGPTGCGKTELILQTAARLNWPVMMINCSESTDLEEKIGHIGFVVKDGQTQSVFIEGELLKAVRNGYILVINESDMLRPSMKALLHELIQGNPLTVSQNGGEVVYPHKNFRLIETANSNGCGDRSGLYRGVKQQNIASMDRYRGLAMDYPPQEVEKTILSQIVVKLLGKKGEILEHLPESVINQMLQLANEARAAFKGDGVDATLTKPISTRSLVLWGYRILESISVENRIKTSFEETISSLATPEDRDALDNMAKVVFGKAWAK